MTVVVAAATDADWHEVRRLIGAYLATLGFDIGFQGLDPELADPAGTYGSASGAALLALDGGRAVGFAGVRPFGTGVDAELKRMYVEPRAAGSASAVPSPRRPSRRRAASATGACSSTAAPPWSPPAPCTGTSASWTSPPTARTRSPTASYRPNPFPDGVYLAFDLPTL